MNRSRKLNGLLILILFLSSLVMVRSLYLSVDEASGRVGFFKQEFYKNGQQDIERLLNEFETEEEIISSVSFYGITSLYNRGKMFDVQVVGVDENDHLFNDINVQYGQYLAKQEVDERVAVVSESMAYGYFGTYDVVGLGININDLDYKVVGVVDDANKVKSYLNGIKEVIFVPVTHYKNFSNIIESTKVEIYIPSSVVDDLYYEKTILYDWDKIDYYVEGMVQSQYLYILYIPIGITVVIMLMKKIVTLIKLVVKTYQKELVIQYNAVAFKDTFRKHWLSVVGILIYSVLIILISIYISKKFYVNSTYVPDKLYSMTHIIQSLSKYISDLFNPIYYTYRYESELLLLKINNWTFLISLMLMGLLLKVRFRKNLMNVAKYILCFMSIFTLANLALVSIELQFSFDMKEYMFLLLSIGIIVFSEQNRNKKEFT